MKPSKTHLFALVKALNKSEKRQFKLYVGRMAGNDNSKFIQLFNLLDKMEKYNEKEIIEKTSISKAQLANSKAHLYKQILTSLRLTPQLKNTQIQIREQLDFATILYDKGLYQQSIKVLDKAKITAIQHEENTIAFEIVEFEKIIETQYITRSLDSRANNLAILAKDLSVKNLLASKLSNLSLQLYSFLLKNGYAKNEDDYARTQAYFQYHLPQFTLNELGNREKLYFYMAQLWYSFIIQDFRSSYKYASKWVDLFHSTPNFIINHPVFYLKGSNYLLESLYFLRYRSRFEEVLQLFKKQSTSSDFVVNDNTRVLRFLYLSYNEINLHFLNGTFELGIKSIPDIEAEMERHRTKIDPHHQLVFYYKFACLHFGADQFERSIHYLQQIIQNKELGMREDLLCYSRILNLISHFELGKDDRIDELIRSTFKFLLKMNDMHQVQAEIIVFLRSLKHIYPYQLKNSFKELHERLKSLENHAYEKRSFLYLDILSWLEGKIQTKPIQEIVYKKVRLMK